MTKYLPQLPGPDRTIVLLLVVFPSRDPDCQEFTCVLSFNLVSNLKNALDGFIDGEIGIVFASQVCLYPLSKDCQHKFFSVEKGGESYTRADGNKSDSLVTECLGILYR